MILKEEIKNRVLNPVEYDIIIEGNFLEDMMFEIYYSKSEFVNDYLRYNSKKTSFEAIMSLIWQSDYIHFIEDVCGDHIYINEPLH